MKIIAAISIILVCQGDVSIETSDTENQSEKPIQAVSQPAIIISFVLLHSAAFKVFHVCDDIIAWIHQSIRQWFPRMKAIIMLSQHIMTINYYELQLCVITTN